MIKLVTKWEVNSNVLQNYFMLQTFLTDIKSFLSTNVENKCLGTYDLMNLLTMKNQYTLNYNLI